MPYTKSIRNVGLQKETMPPMAFKPIDYGKLISLIGSPVAAGVESNTYQPYIPSDQSMFKQRVRTAESTGNEEYIKNFSPAVRKAWLELERERNDPAKQQTGERHEGLFWTVMDNLSRPLYGVAGFWGEIADNKLSEASNPFGAFLKGAALEEKITTADILQEIGVTNPIAKFGLGFVGDVLLDPLTWTGFGAIKSVGTSGLRAGAKAAGRTTLLSKRNVAKAAELADSIETSVRSIAPQAGNRTIRTLNNPNEIPIANVDEYITDAFKLDKLRSGRRLSATDKSEIITNARRVGDAVGAEASNARYVENANKLVENITDTLGKFDEAVSIANSVKPVIFEGFKTALGAKKVDKLLATAKNAGLIAPGALTLGKKVDFLLKVASPTTANKTLQRKLDKILADVGIDKKRLAKVNADQPDINNIISRLADAEGMKIPTVSGIRKQGAIQSGSDTLNFTVNKIRKIVLDGDTLALKKLVGGPRIKNVDDFNPLDPRIQSRNRGTANLIRELLDDADLAKVRRTAYKDITGADIKGLSAVQQAAQEAATRTVIDTLGPSLTGIDELANLWAPGINVGIPFTKLRTPTVRALPFIPWMQEGAIGAKLGGVGSALSRIPVAGRIMRSAMESFDKTFNTASRIDASVGNIVSKQHGSLSQARDATAKEINNSFRGTLIPERRSLLNRIVSNPDEIRNLINNADAAADSIEGIARSEMLGVAGRLIKTAEESGQATLAHVWSSLQGTTPFKFKMNQRVWEDFFRNIKIADATAEEVAEGMLKAFAAEAKLNKSTKNIDMAELIYWLDNGVLNYGTRQGLMSSFKQLGIPTMVPIKDSRASKQVTSTATAMMGDFAKSMRELDAKDFKLGGSAERRAASTRALQDFKGYKFHESVIPALVRAIEISNPNSLKKVQEHYIEALSAWKRWVTVYNVPYYHLRNTYSDMFMNHLNGLSPAQLFSRKGPYAQAMRVLKDLDPGYGSMADELYKIQREGLVSAKGARSLDLFPEIREPLTGSKRSVEIPTSKGLAKSSGKSVIDSADIIALYYKHALQSHFINEDIAASIMRYGGKGKELKDKIKDNPFNREILKASNFRENYFRMANFIHSLKQGMREGISSFDELGEYAADRVRRFNFDYSDFTPREDFWIKNIFPFYKWTRRAVPTILTSLMTQPRVHQMWQAMNRNFQQSGMFGPDYSSDPNSPNIPAWTDTMPSWMLQAGLFPMMQHRGDPVYGGIPLPAIDTLGFLTMPNVGNEPTPVKNALMGAYEMATGMLSPFVQIPMELAGYGGPRAGMPGVTELATPTPPGEESWGDRIINQAPSAFGGIPGRLGNIYKQERYNREVLQDHRESLGLGNVNPAFLSGLTGLNIQANREPRQLAAIEEILDWYENQPKHPTDINRTRDEIRTAMWQPYTQTEDQNILDWLWQFVSGNG